MNLKTIFDFTIALIAGLGGYNALTFIINKISNKKREEIKTKKLENDIDLDKFKNMFDLYEKQIAFFKNQIDELQKQVNELQQEVAYLREENLKLKNK